MFENVPEALETVNLPESVVYEKGEMIYGRGQFQRALGVLLSGRAEAVAQERSSLTVFHAGDAFGAAALFGGEEYVSSIVAATACRVQYIPEDVLQQLFLAYPQTALNYITFLSGKIRFLSGKIAAYASQGVEGRLYCWLRTNCDEAGRLPTGMTMTKLAKALNMGRTSLYRAMEELEKKGLLKRESGEVILL